MCSWTRGSGKTARTWRGNTVDDRPTVFVDAAFAGRNVTGEFSFLQYIVSLGFKKITIVFDETFDLLYIMINEIFILSASSGECILTRRYENSMKENVRDVLWKKLQEGDPSECPPYFIVGNVLYVHIVRQGVYYAATAPRGTVPVLVIDILIRFHQLVKDFCGVSSEASIRSNIILITEVLNEFIDCGVVQLSSTSKLKSYVQTTPVTPRQSATPVSSMFGVEYRFASPDAAERSVIQSRTEQDQPKNEVFVDVIERLIVNMSADGHLERCELIGEVKMRSFLPSSSQIKVKLNEDLNVTDQESPVSQRSETGYGRAINLCRCSFHESAKLDKTRVLSVYPPEGQFSVMSYCMIEDFPNNLPFRLKSHVKESDGLSRDVELSLSLQCEIPPHSQALHVTVRIPVPASTSSVSQQVSGAARGHRAQLLSTGGRKVVEWKMQQVLSKTEETARLKLIGAWFSDAYRLTLGPVSVDFEISGFVCSNVQIRGLQVYNRDTSYTPKKWIRYITTADSYVIKLF